MADSYERKNMAADERSVRSNFSNIHQRKMSSFSIPTFFFACQLFFFYYCGHHRWREHHKTSTIQDYSELNVKRKNNHDKKKSCCQKKVQAKGEKNDMEKNRSEYNHYRLLNWNKLQMKESPR